MNQMDPSAALDFVTKLVTTIQAIGKTLAELTGIGPTGSLAATAYANAHTPSIFSSDTLSTIADLN